MSWRDGYTDPRVDSASVLRSLCGTRVEFVTFGYRLVMVTTSTTSRSRLVWWALGGVAAVATTLAVLALARVDSAAPSNLVPPAQQPREARSAHSLPAQRPSGGAHPPRLVAPNPRIAPARPIPGQMPEALADDLRMFDDDQLRAELASLATSWPRLAILSASCVRRPCPAAVKADDPAELNAFVLAVSNRFGGHVETVLETAAANEHIAQFAVGTSQRFSPAQLVLAAPP